MRKYQQTNLPLAASQLYNKAIEKAAKVVVFYPQSKWVDDALLLMGQAFYRKGEYQRAIRKFQELLANYPQSKLWDEARNWLGESYESAGEYDAAEIIFREMAADKNSPWAEGARYRLAEVLFAQGDYLGAQAECQRLIQTFPKGRYAAKAQHLLGECLYKLGDYAQAQAKFHLVLEHNPDRDLRYRATCRLGECLMAQGKYHQAIGVFQDLLGDEHYYRKFPLLKLKLATCKREAGDYEGAVAEYEAVAGQYPQTEFAAQALFNLGLIYQRIYFDLDKAKQSFQEVVRRGGRSELVEEARVNAEAINRLVLYQSRLKWQGKGQARTRFLLAELYLFRFSQVDSALVQYSIILKRFPESHYAPKAAYALAWTLAQIKGDSAGARTAYQRLIKDYPESEYAALARTILGMDDQVEKMDSPKTRFLQAERQFLKGEDIDGALEGYRQVVKDYPKSEYAPKAQYVIAWIWENLKRDRQMARQAYQKLISDYPDTPYAALARRKLGPENPKSQ